MTVIIHAPCVTCGRYVCDCPPFPLCQACILSDDWAHCQMKYEEQIDRAPGRSVNGSGVSTSDPDIPLVAGGSATILSAWVVVLSLGLVGLAILWEVCR